MAQLKDTTINGSLIIKDSQGSIDVASYIRGFLNAQYTYDIATFGSSTTGHITSPTYTVSGNGLLFISAYLWCDATTDYGQCGIYLRNQSKQIISQGKTCITTSKNYELTANCSALVPVKNGDVLYSVAVLTKTASQKQVVSYCLGIGCKATIGYNASLT